MSKNKVKKTYLYPVSVESHKEGGYHAKCPILQGAWADGETIEGAIKNLRDVIKLILKYREERERKRLYIPSLPSEKAKILQDLNVTITI
jgi:predicted RNase H-like HicB family nuclease